MPPCRFQFFVILVFYDIEGTKKVARRGLRRGKALVNKAHGPASETSMVPLCRYDEQELRAQVREMDGFPGPGGGRWPDSPAQGGKMANFPSPGVGFTGPVLPAQPVGSPAQLADSLAQFSDFPAQPADSPAQHRENNKHPSITQSSRGYLW